MKWKCDKGSRKEIDLYQKQIIKEHFPIIYDQPDSSKREEHESGCGTRNIEETQ